MSERLMNIYERGRFDMFELITSAYYGKQYYFLQDNGMIYSRESGRNLTMDDATIEFLKNLSDEFI